MACCVSLCHFFQVQFFNHFIFMLEMVKLGSIHKEVKLLMKLNGFSDTLGLGVTNTPETAETLGLKPTESVFGV